MEDKLRVDLERINLQLSIPRQRKDESTIYVNEEQIHEEFIPTNEDKTSWIPKFKGPEETLHDVTLRQTVAISNWSEHKLNFAAGFAVYCQLKELEGYTVPSTLDINLFEQYYPLLAEDKSNMSSVLEALWAAYISHG